MWDSEFCFGMRVSDLGLRIQVSGFGVRGLQALRDSY